MPFPLASEARIGLHFRSSGPSLAPSAAVTSPRRAAKRTRGSVVVSRPRPEDPALKPAVDPGDNQRHEKGQSKNEKGDRVEKRAVANLGDRLLNLIDGHHDREELVASVAGRDFEHVPDPGSVGHIVDTCP